MIRTAIREYVRPATVEQAWAVLVERGKQAQPIGGGIDVALFAPAQVTTLVDLTGLGRSYVRTENGLAWGATSTFAELLESFPADHPARDVGVDVLQRVGSPLQRNLATLGGTLGSAHPWSDVIPWLLVLDATLVVYDGQERDMSLVDYLAARREGRRPLILEVRIPPTVGGWGCAYEGFARTGFDVAMLNVACAATVTSGRCAAVRVAVGGTPALARRQVALENEIAGGPLDPATIERVASMAHDAIDARDDRRASAAYRRRLAEVGVTRCLRRIVANVEEAR